MNVDLWFEKQSLALKIILLILPVVGWVMEVLIRISVYVRKQNIMDLVLLILYIVLGWTWIPLILDVAYLCIKGHLFMAADLDEVTATSQSSDAPKSEETVDAEPKEENNETK